MAETAVSRPWGTYQVIDEAAGFKVKRITVHPGQRLSLQYHQHRSERWIVAAGEAEVTIGPDTFLLAVGESVSIPVAQTHRLANLGTTNLELIELQLGTLLEEEDIIRLDDNYGRL